MRKKTALALQATYEELRPRVEAAYPLIPYSQAGESDEAAFIAAEASIGEQRLAAYREAMPELAPALARDQLMTRVFFIAFSVLLASTAVLMLIPLLYLSFLAVLLSTLAVATLTYVVGFERVMLLDRQKSAVPNFYLEYEVTRAMLQELHEEAGLPPLPEDEA